MHRARMNRQMQTRNDLKNLINKKIQEKEKKVKDIMNSVEISMQNLTGEEERKIQSDPTIRKKFAELCSIMEVDPLLICKFKKPKKEEFSVHLKISTKS